MTDSIADLPDAFLLEHNAVTILPMGVLKGTTAYLDKLTIKLKQLFRAMDAAGRVSIHFHAGTCAHPLHAVGAHRNTLTHSSCSAWQTSSAAPIRQFSRPHRSFRLLKSPSLSWIPGSIPGRRDLLVKHAAEMNRPTAASQEEILSDIKSRIPRTKIYVCLNTLATMLCVAAAYPTPWGRSA